MKINGDMDTIGRAIKDIGFPAVVCIILLYAVIWRFPSVLEASIDRLSNAVEKSANLQTTAINQLKEKIERIGK